MLQSAEKALKQHVTLPLLIGQIKVTNRRSHITKNLPVNIALEVEEDSSEKDQYLSFIRSHDVVGGFYMGKQTVSHGETGVLLGQIVTISPYLK